MALLFPSKGAGSSAGRDVMFAGDARLVLKLPGVIRCWFDLRNPERGAPSDPVNLQKKGA
jgi:hypothetical protein